MPSTSKVMTITPEIARSWLETNNHNRPVKEHVIHRYAQTMREGQWELNGETIKFSTEGVLLDGQHRLRAIVQSGVSIESYVTFDLPKDVFDTIDTGATRTIGDMLALDSVDNYVQLGPCLRMLYVEDELGSVCEMGTKLARIVTNRDLLETMDKHPEISNALSMVAGIAGLNKLMSVPVASFLYYKFYKISPMEAESFFIKLARSLDMQENDPIYQLRNRLSNMSKASNAARIETVAITIKAWNAYRDKKIMGASPRWGSAEQFPVAV